MGLVAVAVVPPLPVTLADQHALRSEFPAEAVVQRSRVAVEVEDGGEGQQAVCEVDSVRASPWADALAGCSSAIW